MKHDDGHLARIARPLAEIAQTLESTDEAPHRIQRVLALAREIVPYDRCMLLHAIPGEVPVLAVVPDASADERDAIADALASSLARLRDDESGPADPRPHLTLPVMAVDQIVGVLRLDPPAGQPCSADQLRLLSVVAAQLGAYIGALWQREQDATRARELEAAHDFQQLLAGIVSHDVRAPLHVITMAAGILKRSLESESKTIDRVVASARVAERIVSDLLDVTRARTAGVVAVSPRAIDGADLVRSVVERARVGHPDRTIRLDAADATLGAEWDPDRIAQALTNLIENAIKHGSATDPVVVAMHHRDGELAISVHNRGPAIPDDVLPVIFDPFRQGRERPSQAGGLGLGLFIASHIAQAHGGTIHASSTDSEGTTFVLRLPVRALRPEPLAAERPHG